MDEKELEKINEQEDLNNENTSSAEEKNDQSQLGDDWEFEADAPSLKYDFEVDSSYASVNPNAAEVTRTPVKNVVIEPAKTDANQIVINRDKLVFIPVAIIVAAVIALLVFFGVKYYTVPNGKEGKYMNPASVACVIDDSKVSIGMYNYYYSSILNYYESYANYGYFDLDTSKDYAKQYTTDDDGNEITWEEFFRMETLEEIKNVTIGYNAGLKAGAALTDSQKEMIETQIETLKTSASEQSVSLDEYISSNFGEYCSEDTIRLMLEQYYVSANYMGMFTAENHFTDDEINKYFNENKDDYYQINFDYLAVEYDTENEEVSIQNAEKYMKKMKDEDSVLELVPEVYASYIESDVQSAMEADAELSKDDAVKQAVDAYKSNIQASITGSSSPFDDEMNEWLFNDKTEIGATKYYIDKDSNYIYIVLKTEKATILDDETYSVRHILITPESDTDEAEQEEDTQTETEYTDEQWAAAEKKANAVLDEFQKGDKTEYSFALLAEKNSVDTASLSSGSSGMFGGLYENTQLGQMVPEFENWAIDKSRKYGDTGIVKSDYGYHIMFFVNNFEQYKGEITSALRQEKFNEIIDSASVKVNESVVKKANGIVKSQADTAE